MTLIPITERTQYCFDDCGKEICKCKPTNRIEMNREKTAMQMLIEELDIRLSNNPSNSLMYALETIRIKAKSLLQKEQEQIEKSYVDGKLSNFIISGITSDKYYQSKYGGGNETDNN